MPPKKRDEDDSDGEEGDEGDTGLDDSAWKERVDSCAKETKTLCNGGKYLNALQTALRDPPFTAKSAEIKTTAHAAVQLVLTSVKEAEIAKIAAELKSTELDTLMKYVYRGLGDGKESAKLLKWHAAVVEQGGMGTIVRVMAEPRRQA